MAEETTENTGKKTGRDNLKPPWQKGVSGNPRGRGHTPSITTAMKRLLKETATAEGHTWAEVCGKALLQHLVKGNGAAIKAVLERTEGLMQAEQPDTTAEAISCVKLLLERIEADADKHGTP
jgi:hypothetical protein